MTQKVDILSTKILKECHKIKLKNASFNLTDFNFINVRLEHIPNSVFTSQVKNAIITSQNSVKSILKNFKPFDNTVIENIFCIGKKTSDLLKEIGFKNIICKKDTNALGNYIVEKYPNSSFYFFCSNIRRPEIPDLLKQNNISLTEVISYSTRLKPIELKKTFDAILFYSPSGVRSYLQKNAALSQRAFCIGPTTAQEAKKHFKNVTISLVSTNESLIQTVFDFYKK